MKLMSNVRIPDTDHLTGTEPGLRFNDVVLKAEPSSVLMQIGSEEKKGL
jgi:hypothetical protein